MTFTCSISGDVAEVPVASKSGYVFEKRLIEKTIQGNGGKCPVSGEDLTLDDLLPLKGNVAVKPRPLAASSIPGLLLLFQNEWDGLVSESFQLKMQLDTLRTQLSHALYQHDAACRVIARLLRERDGAQHDLVAIQKQMAEAKIPQQNGTRRATDSANASAASSSAQEPGLPQELIAEAETLAVELKATRKAKSHPDLASSDTIKEYSCQGSFPIHSSSNPGVLSCAIVGDTHRILTGGCDGAMALFDTQKKKTVCKMTGHKGPVNAVACSPTSDDFFASASSDQTVRVWSSPDSTKYTCAHSFASKDGEVVDLSIQATGKFMMSCDTSGYMKFLDVANGNVLKTIRTLPETRCARFHPDGLLFASGGVDGGLAIWDAKTQNMVATLQDGKANGICSMAFSNNGYFFASTDAGGETKLWDLRKAIVFQTIQLDKPTKSKAMLPVQFDTTGKYLALATNNNVHLYNFANRTELQEFVAFEGEHSDAITDVKFGTDCKFVVTASLDNTVKVWGK